MVAILKYSLIRLLLFAVPFGLMFWAGWHPVLSAIVAAVFAGLASYIFFSRQQTQIAAQVAEHQQRRRERLQVTGEDPGPGPTDEDEEDALLGLSGGSRLAEAADEDDRADDGLPAENADHDRADADEGSGADR